jgi:thiamine-phosphate pyrophosphorylase
MTKLRGLYAITPEALEPGALVERVRAALAGGVAAVQYRRKSFSDLVEARSLAALCRAKGALFIVNDDLELAIQSGADGAHVGKDDGDLVAARRRMKGKLVGVSCYNSLEWARAAVAAGADYIAFGSVFASPTKPGAVRAPLALFAEARSLGVPLVAIGGITLENAPRVIGAGADALAVISDLFDAPDVRKRTEQFQKLFSHEVAQ